MRSGLEVVPARPHKSDDGGASPPSATKPIISLYTVHDSNVTIYDPKRRQFFIFDLEKITGEKHYHWFQTVGTEHDKNKWALEKVIKHAKNQFGIENDFSYFIVKAPLLSLVTITVDDGLIGKFDTFQDSNDLYRKKWLEKDSTIENGKGVVMTNFEGIVNYDELVMTECKHHMAHTYCGFAQSPFDDAFVISYDGGGDRTHHAVSKFIDNVCIEYLEKNYRFNYAYAMTANAIPIVSRDTRLWLDLAGKMMGLSAYGDPNGLDYEWYESISRNMCNYKPNDLWRAAWQKTIQNMENDSELRGAYGNELTRARKRVYKDQSKYQKDLAAAGQKFLEDSVIELISEKYMRGIEMCDNNLVLTGGTALNVLLNERIKKEFPNVNVYVPPNPHDGGIPFGIIIDFMRRNNMPGGKHKYNLHQAGPRLFDEDYFRNFLKLADYPGITTKKLLVEELQKGKIVGLIQGSCEIGPRALGFRSILCDPSLPEMKSVLNSKVKNREWYRPFAPVCRLEDAPAWFNSRDFDNMESMSFTVEVKEEYRDAWPSITHVDGTARLQTVRQSDNPLLYDLLTLHGDGPLLNTSFNVSGKPILNTFRDARRVLRDTELDILVVEIDGRLHKFT